MPKKKTLMVAMVVFAGLLSTFSLYIYQIITTPNLQVGKEDTVLIIPENANFRNVQDSVYEYRIVEDMVSFSFIAKLMRYQENVKPGLYKISSDMTNYHAIRMLRAGEQAPSLVTFSHARLADDLYEPITKHIALTPEELSQAADLYIQNNEAGFTKETLIAMFIPNSYQVYYTIGGEKLLDKLYTEYQRYWNDERLAKAAALDMTPLEVSTLASIVQAESVMSDESPIIAGLYINRLKQGIPLQADPTLVFASGDFGLKRVLNIHKAIDSPYNTYKNKGLPPGPINMPSMRSIEAVLNYDKNNYIYMCAKEDFSGYHNFTNSLSVHNANARRYRKRLSIEQRKARAAAD
jgi:UPF0755 protein